ncbi:MAG: alpha/beta hydrolase-fold protein [Solirubrobacterales bacterium]
MYASRFPGVRVALTALLAALLMSLCAAEARADAPNFVSRNGITVSATRWISARTVEADISTSLIAAKAVNGPHRIRVTLPSNYFQYPNARYPVLYLLHGGAGGNSAQWTTGGGDAEGITAGKQLITVMPDGGKVGWFTNWVNESGGAQHWADFYLNQVIPWVDGNLRTIASRDGRAIAGLSMGGYGAVRLAQDRPDLFKSVASFSGAVDLGDMGTRTVVTEQAIENGFPSDGPFGNPFWPGDAAWNAVDPMRRATRLKGLQVLLYAGGGNSDADVIERTMGQSADRFSKTLTANGVGNFWWMYGRPGAAAPYGCDGGHNFGCWNFALLDALPKMLSVLAPATGAAPVQTPANVVANPGFETQLASWSCVGQCGVDFGGLQHGGTNNAWVRNTGGWNDVDQTLSVLPGRTYRVTGWIRTSPNNTDGYFGLRTVSGQVVGERKYQRLDGYTQISVDVNSGSNTQLVVYAGLWAGGDTWAQIDDVSVTAL